MMFRKIWAITWRDLYETYTDTNLLLIMFATPLALATIIGLALGGVADGSSISDIPVALVNMDEGEQGEVFEALLLPNSDASTPGEGTCAAATATDTDGNSVALTDLTATTRLDDVEAARAGVRDGTYAAAIIIPADFSARIGASRDDLSVQPGGVQVYGDPGQTVSATIIRSVTESITANIARGNITVAATIETLQARAQAQPLAFGVDFLIASQSGAWEPNFACAFDPGFVVVAIDQQTTRGETSEFSPLVYFGAAQAMFFLLFTAQGGANSILEDERQGVLGRMLASPTPRPIILLGKLIGTFVAALSQLLILFAAFTVVGSLIEGGFTLIWGNNWLLIGLTALVAALSVSGLGTLLASLAQNPDQANIIGTTINIAMGALGGAFFAAQDIPAIEPAQWLSLVYWGQDAFTTLAAGGADIGLNLAVMLVQGAVMFAAGLYFFNRRFDR